MNTIRRASRNGMSDGGFSLPEMLMVTAITATLLTVSFVNAANMIRNSRQTAMDRQAEQIFLALSRNLQGLEASGNTAFLQLKFDEFTDENCPWLIQIKGFDPNLLTPSKYALRQPDDLAPSKYALYQTDDNRTDPTFAELRNLLFPTDGLSAALSAGLNNGYWLILFTPGMDVERPAKQDKGTVYCFARPTVYQIFFAKNEDEAKESFEKLLNDNGESVTKESVERVAARYGDQDDGRKFRLNELNGYVGYYGGDSQSTKVLTSTRYDSFQCEIEEIQNAEELSVRVKCVIPNDTEYTAYPVEFKLKIEGETSRKTAELIQKPLNAATTRPGENVATFVLDDSGKENPANPTTWKNFLQSNELIPGENLKLTLSASCGVHETESNVIQRVNSLSSSGDAIDGNASVNATEDNGNGDTTEDNGNGGAIGDNGNGGVIGGDGNGGAIDDNGNGNAIDGDDNGDTIGNNNNGNAINGDTTEDNGNGGETDNSGNEVGGNGGAIEDNGGAIDSNENGDVIDSNENGDVIDGDTIEDSDSSGETDNSGNEVGGNGGAIEDNGGAVDGNENGDAVDSNENGGAIDGDGNSDAIDGDGNGDAIDGDGNGDAIDGDGNGDETDGDAIGGDNGNSDGNSEAIGGNDSGDPPTESAPSVTNADEGATDPDSDEALYGWTPKENPENELPSDWNG